MPPLASSKSSKKKLYIIIGVAAVMILFIGIILFFVLRQPKSSPQESAKADTSSFSTKIEPTAFTYAGQPQYDACSLLTLDTVAKHTKGFEDTIKTTPTDTDGTYPDPLMIEHRYIDRNIEQVLPGDTGPRQTSHVLKAGQVSDTQYVNAFASLFDSQCVYNQVNYFGGSGKGFAQVSITQPPVPLSQEFLSFVSSITPDQKQVKNDYELYTAKQKDGNGYFDALLVQPSRNLAVILQAASEDLRQAASEEIGSKLSKLQGIMTLTYPKPYEKIINPCNLLSASDFETYTGKPASALADETLALTPLNEGLDFSDDKFPSVRRHCKRLEVDRNVLVDNIAQSEVDLREFRSSEAAEGYLKAMQTDKIRDETITSIKTRIALGDSAFIKTDNSPNPALPERTFIVRSGSMLLSISVEGDKINSDGATDAFETRMIPIAQKVLQNLRK
jgi:hypothetical protein